MTTHNQTQLNQKSDAQNDNASLDENRYDHLTDEETKAIITPHAFSVNSSLFGLPLATPQQRGVAMLIDTALVAFLAQQDIALLMIVAAATFFKVGSQKKQPKKWRKTRKLFRWLSIFILMGMAYQALDPLVDKFSGQTDSQNNTQSYSKSNGNPTKSEEVDADEATILSGFKYASLLLNFSQQSEDPQCLKDQCWQETATSAAQKLGEDGVDEQTYDELINGLFEGDALGLSQAQKQAQMASLKETYKKYYTGKQYTGNQYDTDKQYTGDKKYYNGKMVIEGEGSDKQDDDKTSTASITDWLKGIIVDDLGFGFGWAAFYFTLFTAWWRGQTPGKRLMGIRVIQLDGNHLGIWDSFGRYGGYGAGFATGLLGFAQIYWDPNRQAIQDKISATVVIKGDAPQNLQSLSIPSTSDTDFDK